MASSLQNINSPSFLEMMRDTKQRKTDPTVSGRAVTSSPYSGTNEKYRIVCVTLRKSYYKDALIISVGIGRRVDTVSNTYW
jgi:hypothetical protein